MFLGRLRCPSETYKNLKDKIGHLKAQKYDN